MENHPFLWRRIRCVRRIQVCMACKGLILVSTRRTHTQGLWEGYWNENLKHSSNYATGTFDSVN